MASIENRTYGTSFRKFNTNLLEDEEYVNKINQKSREGIEEPVEKCRIREFFGIS